MPRFDTLSETLHVGYALCVTALRVQRDSDCINRSQISREQYNTIRAKYPSFADTSFAMELEAHAFKLRTEALEAVEGKGK